MGRALRLGFPAAAFSDGRRVAIRRRSIGGRRSVSVRSLPDKTGFTRNDAGTSDRVVVYTARDHTATRWHSLC